MKRLSAYLFAAVVDIFTAVALYVAITQLINVWEVVDTACKVMFILFVAIMLVFAVAYTLTTIQED